MVEGAVLDLLSFYQRDLREGLEGPRALGSLGIESSEVADHFQLGYCSGKALQVFDVAGELVDLHGLRPVASEQVVVLNWKDPAVGLIGAGALKVHPEVLLCESPVAAMQVRQLGHRNVRGTRWRESSSMRGSTLCR